MHRAITVLALVVSSFFVSTSPPAAATARPAQPAITRPYLVTIKHPHRLPVNYACHSVNVRRGTLTATHCLPAIVPPRPLTVAAVAIHRPRHHHRARWRYMVPRRLRALRWAERQQGKPYCWGGTGPACFDCSGLTMTAYQAAGFELPRTAADQQASPKLRPESYQLARPGDLILFGWPAYHAAIYTGRGQLFNASTWGVPIGFSAIWFNMAPHFYRVIGANVWRRRLA